MSYDASYGRGSAGPRTCLRDGARLGVGDQEPSALELDRVGPGDCFRLGVERDTNACQQGTDGRDDHNWLPGWGIWPEALLDPRQHAGGLGTVCLNRREAEEEFVTEPGTTMLLGSGLMGLAGHAGLRLSTKR